MSVRVYTLWVLEATKLLRNTGDSLPSDWIEKGLEGHLRVFLDTDHWRGVSPNSTCRFSKLLQG